MSINLETSLLVINLEILTGNLNYWSLSLINVPDNTRKTFGHFFSNSHAALCLSSSFILSATTVTIVLYCQWLFSHSHIFAFSLFIIPFLLQKFCLEPLSFSLKYILQNSCAEGLCVSQYLGFCLSQTDTENNASQWCLHSIVYDQQERVKHLHIQVKSSALPKHNHMTYYTIINYHIFKDTVMAWDHAHTLY